MSIPGGVVDLAPIPRWSRISTWRRRLHLDSTEAAKSTAVLAEVTVVAETERSATTIAVTTIMCTATSRRNDLFRFK